MPIPIRQNLLMAAYLTRQRLAKREKYPLIVELEPLFACNLACPGLRQDPVPNGDPASARHPRGGVRRGRGVRRADGLDRRGRAAAPPPDRGDGRGSHRRKRFVYLCTNAILLKRRIDRFKPSPYFSWVVHLDGLKERHDAAVDREGVFDTAIEAIRLAKSKGFRVTTNSTFFTTDSAKTIREVLDFLNDELRVDAMMISPAYAYEKASDQEHFLPVDQAREVFREAFGDGRRRRWRFNHTPLFLDFLEGKVDYQCTPWGIPSYSVFGWQRPCYLMSDGYAATYKELVETTDWDKYGRGRDPRCDNCMAHCGYEPSAVAATTKSLRQALRAAVGTH